VPDLHAIAKELHAKKVDLVATEQNIDTTTPTGRLMFNMLGELQSLRTICGVSDRQRVLQRRRPTDAIAGGRPRSIRRY